MGRKNKRNIGRKISNQEWLDFKPYNTFTLYDKYYLDRAIEIYGILNNHKSWFQSFDFQSKDIQRLACALASHFEDFINEIGIWQFFQKNNKDLYGYPLPFYDLKNYDEDYLNSEDFSYQIWHFMCKMRTRIFGPDAPPFLTMGKEIYELLEPQIEEAPVTEFYDNYFSIAEDIPFFELKSRINWLALESYTLGIEFSEDLKLTINTFLGEYRQQIPESELHHYIYSLQEDYIYSKNSSFSALSSIEWFVGVAKCTPTIKLDLLKLKKRIIGNFIYEKENEEYWVFREIGTDNLFPIIRESVDLKKEIREKGYMQVMTITKWKDNWWVTGSMMGYGHQSASEIAKQKKDVHSIPFYAYSEENQHKLKSDTEYMYKAFVEYFGAPLAIFEDQPKMQIGFNLFNDYYNKKRVKDKEAGEKAQEAYNKLVNKNKSPVFKDLGFDSSHGVGLFFAHGIGNLIRPDTGKIISLLKATSISKEEEIFLFNSLIAQGGNHHFTKYLTDNYPTHNLKFPISVSKINIRREASFLMRFLNAEDFKEAIPNMRAMDMSEES